MQLFQIYQNISVFYKKINAVLVNIKYLCQKQKQNNHTNHKPLNDIRSKQWGEYSFVIMAVIKGLIIVKRQHNFATICVEIL